MGLQVCVQGLQAIPLSVDLWIHYINLLLGTLDMNLPDSPDRIRRYSAPPHPDLSFHVTIFFNLYLAR